MPNFKYIGLNCILRETPIEYSVCVESDVAIIISTRKYEIMEKFAKEVREGLVE